MNKSKERELEEEDYQRAVWFMGRRPYKPDWVLKAACRDVTDAERPEDSMGIAERRQLARRFISNYCGSCPVKIVCTLDMIKKGIPDGTVHGAMMPNDATNLARAVQKIQQNGGPSKAGEVLGVDLIPMLPDYVNPDRLSPPVQNTTPQPPAAQPLARQ